MIQSMTGFGRSETTIGSTQYSIELKSVNHRFLDVRLRLPPALTPLEIPLTEALRSKFERGSFEVSIKTKVPTSATSIVAGTRYVVDERAAKSLDQACEWLRKNLKVDMKLTPEVVAATGKVFVAIEESPDVQVVWPDLKTAYDAALNDLEKMRATEGKRLKGALDEILTVLASDLQKIHKLAPEQTKKIRERLNSRLSQLKLGSEVDPTRLEWEVAMIAEKSDITEEITRLEVHLDQFRALLKKEKGIGRKLDFLAQELHREANTIGSKTTLIEITQSVVELKASIEKLREQVQNVE